jgi:stage II sporulation protein D
LRTADCELRTARRAVSAARGGGALRKPRDGVPQSAARSLQLATLLTLISIQSVVSAGCDRSPTPDADPAAGPAPPSVPAGIDRTIRVLLLDRISTCSLACEQPFDLLDVNDGAVLARSQGASPLTVRFTADSIRFVELDHTFEERGLDLIPRGDKPVRVETPRGPRHYPGTLRFLLQPGAGAGPAGALINVVDMEDYLPGVVSAEMPASFHPQALRAQAIAARTYAWYNKAERAERDWDVTSTESSQVYIGTGEGVAAEAVQAVRDTAGVVCTWSAPDGERIFCTYYSSTCGGSTQAAGPVKNEPVIPPLAGNVICEYCSHSPALTWGPVRLSKAQITEQLRERYPRFRRIGPIEQIAVLEESPSGRPVRLGLLDAFDRGLQLEAENFRLTVDPAGRTIRSTFFTLVIERDSIVFQNGRGFGHGLGMCQYGADGLARAEGTAGQILSFYYPGSNLTRAY